MGLTAVIGGVRNRAHMTIVEHIDRVGKRILSTDNGRCNLTNLRVEADCYRCSRKEFPMGIVRGFGVGETLVFFKGLGIEPKDGSGYIYSNLGQASVVLDVFRSEVERLGVAVLLSYRVEKIGSAAGGGHACYRVCTDRGIPDADVVILAVGPKTAPPTGPDRGGYELVGRLGCRVIKPLPALAQLRYQGNLYRQMAGIHTEAGIKLVATGELLIRDRGELQLTDYGLSDISVFRVSRFAARAPGRGKRVAALVSFIPSWDDGEALDLSRKRAFFLGHRTVGELFTGLLNKKLALVFTKLAGVKPSQKSESLSLKQLKLLLGQTKPYEVIVMSVNPFASAQVRCGGVDISEVDTATMESRFHANLHLAGELLDVDGVCSGYNLQFAWSSGMIAGTHAAGGHSVGKHEVGANKAAAYGAHAPAPDGKGSRK